ncbi:hypothetical protein AAF712_006576 [Marasmius tenuissimus]|uniref:F-box domain-containing protein n=1 Tax=Marasmius tenuissimus TaxID=585030 RepID=A0ABR2ZYT3_9AGAR
MNNPAHEPTQQPPFFSPFNHVLDTNHFPNAEETKLLHSVLQTPQRKVAELNAHIARLETTLEQLRTERDSLQTYIDSHRALLSPFRRFPEDVLREVFLWCLDPYPVRSTRRAPLLLTTICKYWRDIALRTPRLWSSIHVYIPRCWNERQFEALVHARVAGFKRWLELSGSTPLYLSVTFPYQGIGANSYETVQSMVKMNQFVVNALLQFRSRWKDVRFNGVLPAFLADATMLRTDEMPLLECLRITSLKSTVYGYHTMYADRTVEDLIRAAPSLHTLDYSFDSYDVPSLPVPWGQMTEISLHSRQGSLGAQNALILISKMANSLQKCSLWIIPTRIDNNIRIHLPSLKSLELSFQDTRGIGAIVDAQVDHFETIQASLNALTCPSLQHLTVDGEAAVTESPFVQFFEQSGCSLVSFSTRLPLRGNALVGCLETMPGVKTLQLRSSVFWGTQQDTPAAIRAMTPASSFHDGNVLCPSLERLIVADLHPVDAEVLMELLSKRGRELKVVKAFFNTVPQADLKRWERYRSKVTELRKEGVSIEWRFPKVYVPVGEVEDSVDEGHPLSTTSLDGVSHLAMRQMESY